MGPTNQGTAFTLTAHVVHAAAMAVAEMASAPVGADQVVAGSPDVHVRSLYEGADLGIGIWQHSPGTSTDVEADEVFVVLSGQATVHIDGAPALHVGPGDVAFLPAGARTTWTVHETLRKVYIVRP